MIKINQILKYLKKNVYLVCLAIVLAYIAYDKLYKKEGLENNSCEKTFGNKDERIVMKDLDTKVAVFDMNGIKQKHFWIDLQSIKINGSKKLAIVDANQYDVVKKRLNTCEDINIQNNNLKKNLDQYKNRGFFARLFNW